MGVSARPPGSVASEAQAPPVTAPSPAPPHHPAELLKRQSCTCLPAGQQDGGRESHTPPCRDPLQKLCAHTFHVALTGWNPVLLTQGMPGAASLSLSKIRSSRSIHMQLYLGQHVQDRDRELSASTGSFRGPPFEASPRYVPFTKLHAVSVRASHCGCACLGPGPGAQARQLWHAGLAAPRPVGSSRTRGQSRACCAGRWVLFPLSPQGSPQIPPFLPEPACDGRVRSLGHHRSQATRGLGPVCSAVSAPASPSPGSCRAQAGFLSPRSCLLHASIRTGPCRLCGWVLRLGRRPIHRVVGAYVCRARLSIALRTHQLHPRNPDALQPHLTRVRFLIKFQSFSCGILLCVLHGGCCLTVPC